MRRAARHKTGSVVFDKRRKTWNYLWWEQGKRRSRLIGSKQEYATKTVAWKAIESIHASVKQPASEGSAPTVQTLVEQYRQEKMATRYSTRRAYEVWLRNYILPQWGSRALSELQARPVELWL